MDPTLWRPRLPRLMLPARLAPITSPTFSVSNECGAMCSLLFVSKTHNSMNWLPIHCRWPTTTLSYYVPKRTPMTSLQQKLNQLNLATMSLHLDQMLTDSTAKNLSLAQTLEALVDRELESRNQRSIEPPFKLSLLHSMPSIDSFSFTITSPASTSRPASSVSSISTSCVTALACVSSAILASTRPTLPISSPDAPVHPPR